MPETLNDTYGSIRAKVQVILNRQQMLVREIEAQRTVNKQLEVEITTLRRELDKLRADNEYLTMATVLAHKREDVERTRSLLAGLVRDIDRCIADLSAC